MWLSFTVIGGGGVVVTRSHFLAFFLLFVVVVGKRCHLALSFLLQLVSWVELTKQSYYPRLAEIKHCLCSSMWVKTTLTP